MRTRPAVLLIHLMGLLKVALGAIGRAEVSNGRSSGCYRFSQDGLHGLVESLAGCAAKLMAVRRGVDIGAKQDFVCIDVANACQAMLIQEERFYLSSSGLKKLDKGVLRDGQGIRSKSTVSKGFQA